MAAAISFELLRSRDSVAKALTALFILFNAITAFTEGWNRLGWGWMG